MVGSDTTHILVVDDDPKIRLLLRRCFEQEGYIVSEAEHSRDTKEILESETIHLITLDLNLGREDGLSIAREIRANSNVPIIMLTGKGDMVDRVVGLEIGADDYITKPFHVREVLARVRSVIRRSQIAKNNSDENQIGSNTNRFSFSGWVVDFDQLELRNANNELQELTSGEVQLLEIFIKNANRVLSRDQLMDHLKGHEYNSYDRSIDNQIARLRKKIEEDPKKPKHIKTIRGAGYSFVSDIKPI